MSVFPNVAGHSCWITGRPSGNDAGFACISARKGATEPLERGERFAARKPAIDEAAPGEYLRWLRAVTRRIATQTRFVRAVEALADELLRREVVGGRRARSIIQEALWYRREEVAASSKQACPALDLGNQRRGHATLGTQAVRGDEGGG